MLFLSIGRILNGGVPKHEMYRLCNLNVKDDRSSLNCFSDPPFRVIEIDSLAAESSFRVGDECSLQKGLENKTSLEMLERRKKKMYSKNKPRYQRFDSKRRY